MSRYIKKVENKTIFELKDIVENEKSYMPEMVLAALDEMKKRGLDSESIDFSKLQVLESKKLKEERVNEKEDLFPKNLPNSIKYAAYLLYLSLVLNFFLMSYSRFSVGFSLGEGGLSISFGFIIQLAVAISVHRGRNWARWTYVVLVSIGMVLYFYSLIEFPFRSISKVLLSIVELAPVVLLFQSESKKWYKAQKGEQVEEEEFIFPD